MNERVLVLVNKLINVIIIELSNQKNQNNYQEILHKMDIEEIKCPLCTEFYNETDKAPILLPDCGHSFCLICINKCFEELKEEQRLQMLNSDDLQYDDSPILFKCPDDE